MKRIFSLLVGVLLLLFQHSYAEAQESTADCPLVITNFKNNPLPNHPDTLKILGIGNSFTDDGMQYLPDLLKSAGIENVTLGKLSLGGCSLERHYRLYASGEAAYNYVKSYAGKNAWEVSENPCTFKKAVADENWDIIVIQQVSQNAGIYETYQPYLDQLIVAITAHCTNAGVCLAWQMTWAYGTGSSHEGFANYNRNQAAMYRAILKTAKTMIAQTGIDLLIPSATAIQNIRATRVNNPPLDITRDGFHIDLGVGRYTLACTWFQALIAPCLGRTVAGNPFRTANGNLPVTDDNFSLCQQAAQYACIKRFEVSLIDE